jgi:hypothetical protein
MNENIVHHVRGRPAGAQETLPRRTLTCWMLANGKYSAWFRTPNGDGTAIVTLSDGMITGGDSFFEYSGSYEQNGDLLTGVLASTLSEGGNLTAIMISSNSRTLVYRRRKKPSIEHRRRPRGPASSTSAPAANKAQG